MFGLTETERRQVLSLLKREPNSVEWAIIGALWSEHCSYKSSRKWLSILPTTSLTDPKRVVLGPGENAGIVRLQDGVAVVLKIESHNHPSYIDPYQGAATGVGGILRDIFTMGARPVALMNALSFGSFESESTKRLARGVVAGIGGYGNCIGVPTVGGATGFYPCYERNILVNAMALGVVDPEKIFLSKASGVGNKVVYIGAKTGRDGIEGAVMASAPEGSGEKSAVQVGDPFVGKMLMEACLEMMALELIVCIQDMGAAGLSCAASEMSSRGGVGMQLDLSKVPIRVADMAPGEIMLSESQERMLAVAEPHKVKALLELLEKWDLEAVVLGEITNTGDLDIVWGTENVASLPVKVIIEHMPLLERAYCSQVAKKGTAPAPCLSVREALPALLHHPNGCSRKAIWQQYDHMIQTSSLVLPGEEIAALAIDKTALLMSTDFNPHWCQASPRDGTIATVAEGWRHIIATGGKPLALTNCLNFASPEDPVVMGQFVETVKALKEACEILDVPVVSGNVSFYNTSGHQHITPTPILTMIGSCPLDLFRRSNLVAGLDILCIGQTKGWLKGSLYHQVCALETGESFEGGPPSTIDLAYEKRLGEMMREILRAYPKVSARAVGKGGLLTTLCRLLIRNQEGKRAKGAFLTLPVGQEPVSWLLGEDQGRYFVFCEPEVSPAVLKRAHAVTEAIIIGGTTQESVLSAGEDRWSMEILKERFFTGFHQLM